MTARTAFRFVVIVRIVNLFADMTYEGARGITGPFPGSLGATATVVGFVAGFVEGRGQPMPPRVKLITLPSAPPSAPPHVRRARCDSR